MKHHDKAGVITDVYDDIIQNAKEGVAIIPVDRSSRAPISAVIKSPEGEYNKGILASIPGSKKFILEALLPKQLRGMIGVVAHTTTAVTESKAAIVKKTVTGLEKISTVLGIDPERGNMSKGINKLKRTFDLDTKDAISDKGIDALVTAGDPTATLVKQLKVNSAKEFINKQILQQYENDKRNEKLTSTVEYLKNIDTNISAMSKYQSLITNRYQELSLKVRYETLYTLKQVLATTLSYHNVSQSQLSALVYNSSLPDSRKSTLIDLGLANTRSKIVSKIQGKAGVLSRLIATKAGSLYNPKEGGDQVVNALEGANLPGVSDTTIGASTALGFLDDVKLSAKDRADRVLYGGGRLSAMGNLINSIFTSAGLGITKNKDEKGFKGMGSRMAMNALELAEERSRSVGGDKFGADEKAVFDGNTYSTINTVIPGFLAKILQSSEGVRTGKEADLEDYVTSSKTFQKREDINKGIDDSTKSVISGMDFDSTTDEIMALIQKRQTLSPDALVAMRKLVKANIIDNYGSSNPFTTVTDMMGLLNSAEFDNIVPEDQQDEIRHVLKNSKNMLSASELGELAKGLLRGNDGTLGLKRLVTSLVDFYGTAPLIEQGIIVVDGDNYAISKEYIKTILKESIGEETIDVERTYDAEPTDTPEDKEFNAGKVKAAGREAWVNMKDATGATIDGFKDAATEVRSLYKNYRENRKFREEVWATKFNEFEDAFGVDLENEYEKAKGTVKEQAERARETAKNKAKEYRDRYDARKQQAKESAKRATDDLKKNGFKNAKKHAAEAKKRAQAAAKKYGGKAKDYYDEHGDTVDDFKNTFRDHLDSVMESAKDVTERVKDSVHQAILDSEFIIKLAEKIPPGLSEKFDKVVDVTRERILELKEEGKTQAADTLERALAKAQKIREEMKDNGFTSTVEEKFNAGKDNIKDKVDHAKTAAEARLKEAIEEARKLKEAAAAKVRSATKKGETGEASDEDVDSFKVIRDFLQSKIDKAAKSGKKITEAIKDLDLDKQHEALMEKYGDRLVGISVEDFKELVDKITGKQEKKSKKDMQKVEAVTGNADAEFGESAPGAEGEFDTDEDDYEEGSFKDVMAARVRRKAKSIKSKLDGVRDGIRDKAKATVGNIFTRILGPAAPLVGGAFSIIGGLLSFAGSSIGFMSRMGGVGFKLLGALGIAKLFGSVTGGFDILKSIPGAGMIGDMTSGVGQIFTGMSALSAGIIAKQAYDAVNDFRDGGEGGAKRRKKKKAKKKAKRATKDKKAPSKKEPTASKRSMFTKKGLAVAAIGTVAAAAGVNPTDAVAGVVTDALPGDIANVGTEAAAKAAAAVASVSNGLTPTSLGVGEDIVNDLSNAVAVPLPVAVAVSVITDKESKIAAGVRDKLSTYLKKGGEKVTNDLLPKIVPALGSKMAPMLSLMSALKELPGAKLFMVIKDFTSSLFYFMKGPAAKGIMKKALITFFKLALKLIIKLLPISILIDVWIYSRMLGKIAEDLLQKHGISVGSIMYDVMDSLGWKGMISGASSFVAGSAGQMVDFFQEQGVTPFVSSGIESVMDAGEDVYNWFAGNEDKEEFDPLAHTPIPNRKKPEKSRAPSSVATATKASGVKYGPPKPASTATTATRDTAPTHDRFGQRITPVQKRASGFEVSATENTSREKKYGPPRPTPIASTTKDTNEDYVDVSADGGFAPLTPNQPRGKNRERSRSYAMFTGDTVYLPENPTTKHMSLGENVVMSGLNGAMFKCIAGMAREYHEMRGKKLYIGSAFRTAAYQQSLIDQGLPAAPVGSSTHEYGIAIDLNTVDIDYLDKVGLTNKYGFYRTYRHESWHIESIGVQFNIGKARGNSAYAYQRILESVGRGGGGPLPSGDWIRGKSDRIMREVWFAGKTVNIVITDNPPEENGEKEATGGSSIGKDPRGEEKGGTAPTGEKVADISTGKTGGSGAAVPAFGADAIPSELEFIEPDDSGEGPDGAEATALVAAEKREAVNKANLVDDHVRKLKSHSETNTVTNNETVLVQTDPEQIGILGKQLSSQERTVVTLDMIHRELQKLNSGAPPARGNTGGEQVASTTRPPRPMPTNTGMEDGFGLT